MNQGAENDFISKF